MASNDAIPEPVGGARARWRSLVHAPRRARGSLRRARQHSGPDRDLLLLLLKSALAGSLVWALAELLIASAQPAYARYMALLAMQSNAYQSLVHSLRLVIAVLLGVVAAGVVAPAAGTLLPAFVVMLLVVLVIGRWRRLGPEGVQVSVVAVFSYDALSGAPLVMVWEIVSMVLLGAGVGLTISLLVMPPLRYRTAEQGADGLSWAFGGLLTDIADGLREGVPERDTLIDWLGRARQLDHSVQNARQAVESGDESVVYNVRRLLSRRHPTSFAGYRGFVDTLGRSAEQLRSICYGLLRTVEEQDGEPPDDRVLRAFAELLDELVEAVCQLGAAEGTEEQDPGALTSALRRARERQRELAGMLEGASAWREQSVLYVDADRLINELARGHDYGALHPPLPEDRST
ncbi:aromatic acid exporter family protein [Streptomyces oceani]|uniref:aromatic acid exporter family protein n=1 Tax=Streptomyces oceani TaxID=1075402 RepID=UPI00087329BC|nr:aromatic acid exporter family protein [Streptomyces oceani]